MEYIKIPSNSENETVFSASTIIDIPETILDKGKRARPPSPEKYQSNRARSEADRISELLHDPNKEVLTAMPATPFRHEEKVDEEREATRENRQHQDRTRDSMTGHESNLIKNSKPHPLT
jgi:hypothetical protein